MLRLPASFTPFVFAIFILAGLGSAPAMASSGGMAPIPDSGPLARVARMAQKYALKLSGDGKADYKLAERNLLNKTVDVLLKRGHCKEAGKLSVQVVSGKQALGRFWDWFRLAHASLCARNWGVAIRAAWLSEVSANSNARRAKALLVLGKAMEGHWSFDTRAALTAYRRAREYSNDAEVRDAVARLEQALYEEQGLRIDRHFVQTDGPRPSICLDFSADMRSPGDIEYGDYIRFEPPFEAVFEKAAGDEVCAKGAGFGKDYQVRLLPGLTAENGAELRKPLRRRVEIGARPPALWFANSRYVLPPGGGVPIHDINVAKAKLSLYRIGDRNLLEGSVRERFRSDLYPYQAEEIRDRLGEQVWQGEADLAVKTNREAVTNLPVATLIDPKPGVYVLTAKAIDKDSDDYGPLASQWLVVSDIGLTSYRGKDGLTVTARSLGSARPLAGVALSLVARNNVELGSATTDAAGVARFETDLLAGSGGREPAYLMAADANGRDFNFLDIDGAPFDLSDRGVAGRPVPGPMDAFVYTERGVYRPGESVHVGVLLRDDRGLAVAGMPLTLRLLRPDGGVADQQVVQPEGAGGYQLALPVSSSARTGSWLLQAYLDRDAAPVGSAKFLVEAIMPPRIEVDATSLPETPLSLDSRAEFGIEARYLFGAPAADLKAAGELRIEPDPEPFPALKGYRFGPVDDPYDSRIEPLPSTRTDADGRARFPIYIAELPDSKRPLRVRLRAEVSDVDGRSVAVQRWLPLRHEPLYIGIDVAGDETRDPAGDKTVTVAEGSEAKFKVVAVDADGRTQARSGLHYRLVEEQISYQWYQSAGRWQYQRQVRDRERRQGELQTRANEPATLAFVLDYGRYRLEVSDPVSGWMSSVRVQAGWSSQAPDSDSPDRLSLRSDRQAYRPGERAQLHIEAPFTGSASVVIAGDRVLSVRNIELTGREQDIEIEVDPEWGAGAYALVTVYRPDDRQAGHGPRRAVGVAWLGLDESLHRLDVAIESPDRSRPGSRVDLGIQVSGQAAGEPVWLTLAAVDEGVLQLTDFQNPDPLGHYYGQRRLGVDIRDLYGRLIDGHAGSPGRIRSGGGGSAGRDGAPDSDIHIVSLFSGVIAVDAEGRASVPLDLPEFDGRLRLIAVAWSPRRVGSAAGRLTVRDPVVLMPSLPRFMAVGDQAQATVMLHNIEGPAGDYHLQWAVEGPLGLSTAVSEQALSLEQGGRQLLHISLRANDLGTGRLQLKLSGPAGLSVIRSLEVGIRAAYLPETRRRFGRLAAGKTASLGSALVGDLLPATVSARLSVSSNPDLDVPGLLRELDLYPYGCLEQVTSRAMPLLHLDHLATVWGYRPQVPVGERLSTAIAGILDKQLYNGGFALWDARGREELWLSVYAMDFLQRARAAAIDGIDVPDFAWQRGLTWLRRLITYPNTDDKKVLAAQAYALYVLARNGEANIGTARYLLDQGRQALPSPIAAAQLGAALALMGDSRRAEQAFGIATRLKRSVKVHDYGSPLRDRAALLLLRSEVDLDVGDQVASQVADLREAMAGREWLSTQEQAWLVRAADAVSGEYRSLTLDLGGESLETGSAPLARQPGVDALAIGLRLKNRGPGQAWYSLAVSGSPRQAPPPLQAGFEIRRTLYDLKGNEVNPLRLQQGQSLVVVIEGRVLNKGIAHQALIVDPLPAGIEVNSTRLADSRNAGELRWLPKTSRILYSEALDDRYIAALDLKPGKKPGKREFRVAYLARAVTPGNYQYPPVAIEDMYKPRYRGRGDSGWAKIGGN
jgi:uncharacterized protein YfaS (alpha-2-macroglobulin family)